MKSFVTKLCASMTAACLAVSMVPAVCFAEVSTLASSGQGTVTCANDWELVYTVSGDEATVDHVSAWPDGTADLSIPAEVADPEGSGNVPVTGIGEYAFCANSSYSDYPEGPAHLAAVTLPDSVRYLEEGAFRDTSMTSLHIGTGIAYVKSYGVSYNASMTSLEFADGAHPEYFGKSAFTYNTALLSLDIPGMRNHEFSWSYRLGDRCFDSCTALETVIFEGGSTNGGSDYTWGDGYGDGDYFTNCTSLSRVVIYLENLNSSLQTNGATIYYPLYFYKSSDTATADTDRENYGDCIVLQRGTSFSAVSAGTVDSSRFFYDNQSIPSVSTYSSESDMLWGFSSSATYGDNIMGENTTASSLRGPSSAYPVSRNDMDYATLSLDGAHTETSGDSRDTYTTFYYYKYYSGSIDPFDITVHAPDGTVVDSSCYKLVFKKSGTSKSFTEDEVKDVGDWEVYAQGLADDYTKTKTETSTFELRFRTPASYDYTGKDAYHAAGDLAYSTVGTKTTDLGLYDPDAAVFVTIAPASDWRACMLATALAGAGHGIALFCEDYDTDESSTSASMWQTLVLIKNQVDVVTYVGNVDETIQDRVEVIVGNYGTYNEDFMGDDGIEDLAVYLASTVREYGPEATPAHEWGDTAVLMSSDSCLGNSSIAQFAYQEKAPVLYTSKAGEVSDETVEELSHYSRVVVAANEETVPDSALAELASVEIERLATSDTALGSSIEVASELEIEFGDDDNFIVMADSASPICVMTAAQTATLAGGTLYACGSSAEAKICQQMICDSGPDNVGTLVTVGPFTDDPLAPERIASIWTEEPLSTEIGVGDSIASGGAILYIDSDDTAYLDHIIEPDNLEVLDVSTVSLSGMTWTVTAIKEGTLQDNDCLTSVHLDELTSIDADAFDGCISLVDVSLDGLTSLPEGMFAGNTRIVSISLDGLTSIDADAFVGCISLSSISLNSITSLPDGLLDYCDALTGVFFDSLVTAPEEWLTSTPTLIDVSLNSITSLPDGAFAGYDDLRSVSLDSVTSISASMFANKESLVTVSMNSLTAIPDRAFRGCSALYSVSFDVAATVGVSAFENCTLLSGISLPVAKTLGASVFSGCASMKTVDLPKATTLGASAFVNCTLLSSISLSAVTSVGASAFSGCAALTSAKLPKATSLASSIFKGCKKLTSVTAGSATSVGASAFNGCSALKSVSLPAAKTIGSSAFSGCSSLQTVSIPKASSIPANAFKGLKKLTSVSAGSAASVGASAFNGCSALRSVNVSSAKSIGTSAFAGCTALGSVKLSKVTSVPASAFKGDKKLASASFGAVKSVGANAFQGCTALKSAPVSKATTVGKSAFSGCASLKTVKLNKAQSIGASAFKGCKKMTKATLSSKKLKSIGKQAFSGCKKLKKITVKSTKLQPKKIGKKAFKGTNKKCSVKVPKSKLKAYKKAFVKTGLSKKATVKA